MKKKLLSLLFLVATLALTGCGYKKPEVHSMLGMNIKSITTVCGTDCSMDTIDTSSTSDHGMITYYYTDVAGDKGISDAKTYYNYLKSEKHCIKIDDFDEKKGNYSAYFQLNEKQVKSGFLMKVNSERQKSRDGLTKRTPDSSSFSSSSSLAFSLSC